MFSFLPKFASVVIPEIPCPFSAKLVAAPRITHPIRRRPVNAHSALRDFGCNTMGFPQRQRLRRSALSQARLQVLTVRNPAPARQASSSQPLRLVSIIVSLEVLWACSIVLVPMPIWPDCEARLALTLPMIYKRASFFRMGTEARILADCLFRSVGVRFFINMPNTKILEILVV